MNVEILHIDECPNWEEAGARLREALAATGYRDTEIRYRTLISREQAGETVFAGSPTITIDGRDLFPSADRTSDLACRIYVTTHGLAGLPTLAQLIEALTTHG